MAAPRARPRRRLSILSLEDRVTPVGELLHTLSPPTNTYLAGTSVAASTTQYVVVGAQGSNSFQGSAAVYDANSGALLWNFTDRDATNSDYFGTSVAVGGNYVAVGAPGDGASGTGTGRAYVYDATTGNLVSTLINPAPDPGQNPPEGFGDSVAVIGSTVFVAADYDPHPSLYSGNVYEFDAATGSYLGTLTPPAAAVSSRFGSVMAASGSLLAVSAPTAGSTNEGEVYVYDTAVSLTAPLWTVDEPTSPAPGPLDDFGRGLALDGHTLVVGAPKRDIGGNTDVGAAYVFDLPAGGGAPTLRATINNPHPDNSGEWFGHSVGIANGAVLVGSPYDDTHVQYGGEAYLFNASTGAEITPVLNPHTTAATHFGWSGTAAGDKLILGADFADEGYIFQGEAPSGPPTVTINQAAGQGDPTNSTLIRFDVVFAMAVSGFTGSDVSFTGSTAPGPLTANVSGSGSVYTVTVTGMTGPGTVVASIPAGAATDSNNDANQASTSTDNSVTFDNVRPDVTINQDPGQADPTAGSPIVFDVHFTKAVSGFTGSDVSFAGSTDAAHLSAAVSGSGQDYTVNVTVLAGSAVPNTVVVSVPANAAADAAGNGNTASTSTDATVIYGQVGTLQFGAPTYEVNENGGAIEIPVSRSGIAGAVSADYAMTDGTAVAGTDYTGESGTLTWTNGDGSTKTITISIADLGVPAADKTFAVALSNFAPAATAGTPATTTVTIGGLSGLAFDSAAYTANEGDTAVVTVRRLSGDRGAVSVHYATSDGTATLGSDYTPQSGTLSWADGDTADKTFTVPIIDDTVSEGRETIDLTLSGVTGNAVLGSQATSVLTIAASDYVKGGVPSIDADGDIVTPKLSGPGALTYYLTNGTGPISEIDLFGTDPAKSTASVAVVRQKGGTGDGRVQVGEVDGTRVKSLALAKADLIGAGIDMTGFAGAVTIGAVKNGADILLNTTAEAPPVLGQTVKITAGVIGDGTDVSVAGTPLGSLTAISIGHGTITAPSVGSIVVKGRAKTRTAAAIPGDFQSSLTVAGTGLALGVPALKSLRAAGAVNGAVLNINGDVGSVSVGSFVDSELFAGYSGSTDGSGTFNLPSTVKSFTVRAATNGFENGYVIAANFKTVMLASAVTANGGVADGFVFQTSFGKLAVKSPALAYTGAGKTQILQSDLEVMKV